MTAFSLHRGFLRLLSVVFCFACTALAEDPKTGIWSPSQTDRDAAAKLLRETFHPSPRAQWEAVIAKLEKGDTREQVLEKLKEFHPDGYSGVMGGGSFSESYRLDASWEVRCTYNNRKADKTLFHWILGESTQRVWVKPPAKFTGLWITYFANGQRSHEIHYREGKYFGDFTSFLGDGSKVLVHRYGPDGLEEGFAYFPSGALKYHSFYKGDKPTGTWIYYNEDGTIQSTKAQPAP
jgi:antitoxin component YwqK of YwqJK toxin-antitoxin module